MFLTTPQTEIMTHQILNEVENGRYGNAFAWLTADTVWSAGLWSRTLLAWGAAEVDRHAAAVAEVLAVLRRQLHGKVGFGDGLQRDHRALREREPLRPVARAGARWRSVPPDSAGSPAWR